MDHPSLACLFLFGLLASFVQAQEICANGIDDDGDGLIDLNDAADCPCTHGAPPVATDFVPNPSFEASHCLPTVHQGPAGPNDCVTDWGSGDLTSPDYFHLQAPWGVQLIPQPIPDGQACMGMMSDANDGGQEHIGTCLLDTLEAGRTYRLRVHVAMGGLDNSITTNVGVTYTGPAQLALWGTTTCAMPPINTILCPVGGILLGSVAFAPLPTWQPITITFTPTADITAIALGPPCGLPSNMHDPTELTFPYMWVDSVGISEVATYPAITATGTWCGHDLVLHGLPGVDDAGMQWFHNGVALVGRTDSLLHLQGLPEDTGLYQFAVDYADGCAFAEHRLVADPLPQVSFTADPAQGCAPLHVAFTNTTDEALTDQVRWDFGDGATATGTDAEHAYTGPGTYDVHLRVTSAAGCAGDTTYTDLITVFATPTAQFTYTPEPLDVFHAEATFSSNASSTDVVRWSWAFTGGAPSTDTLSAPTVTFPSTDPSTYPVRLVVTNANGCTDTLAGSVVVEGVFSVYVPNSFTPDGDGVNEGWRPICKDFDPKGYDLRVFDRWGREVWSSTDAQVAWDGRVGGDDPKTDVYVWKLRARDAGGHIGHELLGHVTLLR